ncbi:MAG: YHS domain-containing protein, partial [Rhizobiales bacterium]|nr:YHS domain-containing protein [Hyphomicrobiales bacterium]
MADSCCSSKSKTENKISKQNETSEEVQFAIDPVCGMKVDINNPDKKHFLYKGENYHFCNPKCYDKFSTDPDYYLTGQHKVDAAKQADEAPKGTRYTCSCHPEIIEYAPGVCPKCGMALEVMDMPSDQVNPELVDFTKRLWVSAPLAIILLVIEMSDHILNINLLP